MRKELTYQIIKQNSAQNSNITTNPTKHIPNTAQGNRVPNNHIQDVQNSAQNTNVTTNLKKTTIKTVRKELP